MSLLSTLGVHFLIKNTTPELSINIVIDKDQRFDSYVCAKNNTIGLSPAQLFKCPSCGGIGDCLTTAANRNLVTDLTWRASRRLSELAQQTYGASLAQGQHFPEYKLKTAQS